MITATMIVATIPVTDLERSKQFYGETLGLTFPPVRSPSSSGRRSPPSTPSPISKSMTSKPRSRASKRVASTSSTTPKGRSRQRATSRNSARLVGRGSTTPMGTRSASGRHNDWLLFREGSGRRCTRWSAVLRLSHRRSAARSTVPSSRCCTPTAIVPAMPAHQRGTSVAARRSRRPRPTRW